MELAALLVAFLALLVSGASVVYTRQQALAAKGQAKAAQDEDRRARTPQLDVELERQVGIVDDSAIYIVRNNGPQDLDSVVVDQPDLIAGVTYPICLTGTNWSDRADLGSLRMNQAERFTLSIGVEDRPPAFRVIIHCTSGTDEWHIPISLAPPRKFVAQISGPPRLRRRPPRA